MNRFPPFWALAGFGVGCLFVMGWICASHTEGFATPTKDQTQAVMDFCSVVGIFAWAAVVITIEWRR